MTIMLSRYSGFPPELFEKGLAPKMRDCSFRLYLLLCRESDRMSSRRITFNDSYAKKQASVSSTSMRVARKQLSELRLIVCERSPGGEYRYDLCDLRTGLPYPGDPKAHNRKRQSPSTSGFSGSQKSSSSRKSFIEPEFDPPSKRIFNFGFPAHEETAFPFGANRPKRGVA